jgi:O-antigen/teichoic acid export membrane protein
MAPPLSDVEDGPMEIILVLGVLGVLAAAGAGTAIVKATSPEDPTGRRVELSILGGLLALVTLFLALVGYWLWQFPNSFTF